MTKEGGKKRQNIKRERRAYVRLAQEERIRTTVKAE